MGRALCTGRFGQQGTRGVRSAPVRVAGALPWAGSCCCAGLSCGVQVTRCCGSAPPLLPARPHRRVSRCRCERGNSKTSLCRVTFEDTIRLFSKARSAQGADKTCSLFHAPASTSGPRTLFVHKARGCRSGALVPATLATFCTYLSSHSITHPLSSWAPRRITFY